MSISLPPTTKPLKDNPGKWSPAPGCCHPTTHTRWRQRAVASCKARDIIFRERSVACVRADSDVVDSRTRQSTQHDPQKPAWHIHSHASTQLDENGRSRQSIVFGYPDCMGIQVEGQRDETVCQVLFFKSCSICNARSGFAIFPRGMMATSTMLSIRSNNCTTRS